MKPSVVLQTDFSLTWSAVSAMKGVIKIVDPRLEIYDITHDIKTYDVFEASLSLQTVVYYWPSGTVFVSVVDPGVGTHRKASVAKLKNGSLIVTPDNGSLTHLKKDVEAIYEIDTNKYFYHGYEKVHVFHGRDVFGYVGGLLASGKVKLEEIGPEYPVSEIVEDPFCFETPTFTSNGVVGVILTGLAHFGGVQLNVENKDWPYAFSDRLRVEIMHEGSCVFDAIVPYVPSFGHVQKGEPLLYQGSSRYISLDCNQDNFMKKYGVGFGKGWTFRITKRGE